MLCWSNFKSRDMQLKRNLVHLKKKNSTNLFVTPSLVDAMLTLSVPPVAGISLPISNSRLTQGWSSITAPTLVWFSRLCWWLGFATWNLFWARVMAAASPSYVKANPPELESMMKELGLEDEDLDDVVFQRETNVPTQAILWMSIARVDLFWARIMA